MLTDDMPLVCHIMHNIMCDQATIMAGTPLGQTRVMNFWRNSEANLFRQNRVELGVTLHLFIEETMDAMELFLSDERLELAAITKTNYLRYELTVPAV